MLQRIVYKGFSPSGSRWKQTFPRNVCKRVDEFPLTLGEHNGKKEWDHGCISRCIVSLGVLMVRCNSGTSPFLWINVVFS